MSLFRRIAPSIRFLCQPEDEGVIAPPVPAKPYLPDWFRKLAPVDERRLSPTDTGLTVKRCMPFLDAMTTGWIIPPAATVRMEIRDDGREITAGWDFDRTLVSNHGEHQVAGNPMGHRPPRKFHNFWTIMTPPGWSCLFVNPLSRPNGVFEVVAGVVDTDTYRAPIHFPFFATGRDGLHVIDKGSPLVQVIPFRRDSAELAADIRSESVDERADRDALRCSVGWLPPSALLRPVRGHSRRKAGSAFGNVRYECVSPIARGGDLRVRTAALA